jgi:hypothetical protein
MPTKKYKRNKGLDLPIYLNGGTPPINKNLQTGAGVAGMAGGLVTNLAGDNQAGNIAGGALSGAAAGAMLGPLGMAGGAIIGGIGGLMKANAAKKAKEDAEFQQNVQNSIQANAEYRQQLTNNQANIPTFPNGGTLSTTEVATNNFYNESLPKYLPTIKDKAELYYYANRLNSQLKNKNPEVYNQLSTWNPDKPVSPISRIKQAEPIAKANPDFYLAPEEQKTVLGKDFDRYAELRGKYGKELNLIGSGDSTVNEIGKKILKPASEWTVGARHAVAFNPAAHTYEYQPGGAKTPTNKFHYEMTYDPTQKNPYITSKNESYTFNPQTKNYEKSQLSSTTDNILAGTSNLRHKTNGGYIIDYKGASHANEGIPVNGSTGNPVASTGEKADAEVEGKEVGAKLPNEETPYIFSHKLGFADKARKIQKKYSKRPDEKMSQDAMYMELGGLMKHQEEVRGSLNNHMEDVTYSEGGKIHINPANKGKFTASASKAGMGTQEFARHVLAHKDNYSTTQIKRANFARNASKFHHELGGSLEENNLVQENDQQNPFYQYKCGGKLPKYDGLNDTQLLPQHQKLNFNSNEIYTQGLNAPVNPMYQLNPRVETGYGLNSPKTSYNIPEVVNGSISTDQQEEESPYRGSNLSLFMGAGTALANLGLAASVKTPKDISARYVRAGRIDTSPIRKSILENAMSSRANRLAAMRGVGASQAQYLAGISTADSDINRSSNEAIRQAEMEAQSKNTQMDQSAQEANARYSQEATMYNAQQKYGAEQQRRSYLTNALQSAGTGIQSYLGERQKYDTLGAVSENYDIIKDKYGRPKFVPKTR